MMASVSLPHAMAPFRGCVFLGEGGMSPSLTADATFHEGVVPADGAALLELPVLARILIPRPVEGRVAAVRA
jgi:hypothetical protein